MAHVTAPPAMRAAPTLNQNQASGLRTNCMGSMVQRRWVLTWATQRVRGAPRVVTFSTAAAFDNYVSAVRKLGGLVAFSDPWTAVAKVGS